MSKEISVFSITLDGQQLYHQWDLRDFKDGSTLEPLYMMMGMLEKMKRQTLDRIELIESGGRSNNIDDDDGDIYDDDDIGNGDVGGNWKLD